MNTTGGAGVISRIDSGVEIACNSTSSVQALEQQRPRNLDWKRAAALLYGDWGTSKAYVIGLAFAASGFASLPVILAVSAITLLVGVNYMIICRCFPDGGGVYSAARMHGRTLSVVGALLLIADLTVTAALSGWAALSYLGVPGGWMMWGAMGVMVLIGLINNYGPRHSGTFAAMLAVPAVVMVVGILLFALPHLTTARLEPLHEDFSSIWIAFVGVILALSGVEAMANLTGTLKPDKNSPPGQPRVGRSSFKAILPVALEVSIGTALLGWAMLSLPRNLAPEMLERKEDMLRFLAERFSAMSLGLEFGVVFGWMVGIVFALLLLSAVNTAVSALVGVVYMMSREGDMPHLFARLNRHGVPVWALVAAVLLPVIVLAGTENFDALAALYAIGVVGAICVNLGSCTLSRALPLHWAERGLMGATFLILCAVELTIARTKPDALFFVVCVLVVGLGLFAVSKHLARTPSLQTVPTAASGMRAYAAAGPVAERQPKAVRILVCVRGFTPVLAFAMEEACLRGAALYVMHVREVAVLYRGPVVSRLKWQDDPEARALFHAAMERGGELGIETVPVFASSSEPGQIIADTAATLGVDMVILGATHRSGMAKLLKGDVAMDVANSLPDNIALVIVG